VAGRACLLCPGFSDVNLTVNKWELYNIDKDFSEAIDLADNEPGRLKESQAEV